MTISWAWIIAIVVFAIVVGNLMLLKYSAKLPMSTKRRQDKD